MCDCHSILECCVVFSGVKLSIRSFNLFVHNFSLFYQKDSAFLTNKGKAVIGQASDNFRYKFIHYQYSM